MEEIWKKVQGWGGRYEVSNKGNLRSNLHGLRMRKLTIGSKGYLQVRLHAKTIQKTYQIHTLVVEAFIGTIKKGQHVNHVDGNPLNNCAENLEIGSVRENVNHFHMMRGTSSKGVKTTKSGKFSAQARINGRIKHLGTFDEKQQAADAYINAIQGEHRYV